MKSTIRLLGTGIIAATAFGILGTCVCDVALSDCYNQIKPEAGCPGATGTKPCEDVTAGEKACDGWIHKHIELGIFQDTAAAPKNKFTYVPVLQNGNVVSGDCVVWYECAFVDGECMTTNFWLNGSTTKALASNIPCPAGG